MATYPERTGRAHLYVINPDGSGYQLAGGPFWREEDAQIVSRAIERDGSGRYVEINPTWAVEHHNMLAWGSDDLGRYGTPPTDYIEQRRRNVCAYCHERSDVDHESGCPWK
jgi:hypothetical protein